MQWSAAPHAGFSKSTPWLPLADDFAHENVVNLEADERSILSLYKALIDLRNKLPELKTGDYVARRRRAICCSTAGKVAKARS